MIRFRCTKCGEQLEAPQELAGKALQCPSCNLHETVPVPQPPPLWEQPIVDKAQLIKNAPPPKEKLPIAASPRSSRIKAGNVIIITIAVLFFMYIFSPDDSTEPKAKTRNVPVKQNTTKQKSPSTTPSQATAPKTYRQETVLPAFMFLRKWKPENLRNSFGADVLLQQDLTEQHLIAFVKQLAGKHDPVIIRVWTSRTAWQDEDAKTPEFKSDYILFYVKNLTGKRAYIGFNEIRWMQEVGKYSHKYGRVTKF